MNIETNDVSPSIEYADLYMDTKRKEKNMTLDSDTNLEEYTIDRNILKYESNEHHEIGLSVRRRNKQQNEREFKELDDKIESLILKVNGIWTCQVCGKQSGSNSKDTNNGHLATHVERSHMDLSLPCLECGHILNNRDSLRAHRTRYCKLRTDAVARNIQYECTFCGKVLKSKYDLRQHAEKHLAEIPKDIYNKVCKICGKVFESKGSLHRHYSIQHEKKPKK